MVEGIQNYIGSLNWGYRVALREKTVTYLNAYGEFIGPHKIKVRAEIYISFNHPKLAESTGCTRSQAP